MNTFNDHEYDKVCDENEKLRTELDKVKRISSLAIGRDEETLAFVIDTQQAEIERLRGKLASSHAVLRQVVAGNCGVTDVQEFLVDIKAGGEA